MSLSVSIKDFARSAVALYDGVEDRNALGIELEYENVNLQNGLVSMYWVAVSDGSLRNHGLELKSRPLAFGEVDAALSDAETILDGTGAIATARCGLHTHMNMRPYSVGQVWSLAALYAIIEPTLYLAYAVRREDSMFAVPMWLNTSQVEALYGDINNMRSNRPGASLPGCLAISTSKYSALNFHSLHVFGTLEMRQPYCSNDFNAIRSWTDFCQRLVEIGTSFEDPFEVITYFEQTTREEIQERMFGQVYIVDENIQEVAEDNAYFIAGVVEPAWQDLEWRIA